MSYGYVPIKLRNHYRIFYISKIIFENTFHNCNEIGLYLDKNGYGVYFKDKNLQDYIDEVAFLNGSYNLKKHYLEIINQLNFAKDKISYKQIDSLYSNIKEYVKLKKHNMTYHLDYEFLYEVSLYLLNDNDLADFSFFYVVKNYNSLSFEIENHIFKLNDKNSKLSYGKLSQSHFLKKIMEIVETEYVDELINRPINMLVSTFNIFAEDFLKLMRFYFYDYTQVINNYLEFIIENTEKQYIDILVMRNGWDGSPTKTLEEIGAIYGVTRERVRQKEKKATDIMLSKAKFKRQLFHEYSDFLFYNSENDYILINDIECFYGNNSSLLFLILEQIFPKKYVYVSKYNILHKSTTSIEEVLSKLASKFPLVVSKREYSKVYDELADNDSKAIKEEIFAVTYVERDGYYIKKGLRLSQVILALIDELFPDGYSISNDDHYKILLKEIQKRYSVLKSTNVPKRKVTTAFYNHNYKTIDKGTYVNSDKMPEISERLLQRIRDLIDKREVIYYDSVFEIFKNDLKEYGIKNKYHLKGTIDDYLEYEYNIGRDSISVDHEIRVKDKIIEFVHKNDGEVTKKELLKAFKGLPLTILSGVIYYNDDLLYLSNDRVIKTNLVVLSNDSKEIIRRHFNALLNLYGVQAVNASKLYSRILFLEDSFFKDNKHILDYKDLSTIIKQFMSNDFYLNGTIISSKETVLNETDIIKEFLKTKKSFEKRELDSFISEMHLRPPNNFLQFIDDISDLFVQVGIESFINKEAVQLNSDNLKKIEEKINFVLLNQENINTSIFRGYFLLPRVDFSWNKYSLAGIVRSFFKSNYKIENTSHQYPLTDFIIRRG
ncbi:MAG: sigma factor-like helix-turn-helix DNA-binding protein [Candidatus Izemoplasmataceae bacterium]